MTDWLLIAFGVVLTAGTAVFVASEFSLVALDPAAVERRIAAGDRRAAGIGEALRTLSTQLSGAQVGITLTTILLGYSAQGALARLLTPVLGGVAGETAAAAAAVTLSVLLVNGFSMLFGELVPKNWAIADPMHTAGWVSPAQRLFTRMFLPAIRVLNGSANRVLRRMGVEPSEELSGARSPAELAALVRHSAEQGTLDVSTATLLTRSIGLGALTAVDVMTDRGRLHALAEEDSAADVVALARATGHSRFPVFGDDPDDVKGIVHLRRAIAVPFDKRQAVPVTSSSLMTPAPRVPETMPLAALLVELRGEGFQMAVVVDEYGGTAGVVTLEDAVEEIVGDVADEHDRRRVGAHVDASGQWIVPGWMRPDELASRASVHVPDDGPYETLGGLVMTELGRIPRVGDQVTTPRAVLVIQTMDGRRVTRLRVWSTDSDDGPDVHHGGAGEAVGPGRTARGTGPGASRSTSDAAEEAHR